MIYTFYSYKGGVGRSMALANVAEAFYQQGLRVLLIDWDLEAPGLENYFYASPKRDGQASGTENLPANEGSKSENAVPQTAEEVQSRLGLVDMLVAYKRIYPRLLLPSAERSAITVSGSASLASVTTRSSPAAESAGAAEGREASAIAGGSSSLDNFVEMLPDEDPLSEQDAQPQASMAPASRTEPSPERKSFRQILDERLPPLSDYLYSIHAANGQSSALWLLPSGWRAGKKFASYAKAVQSFDWDEFYREYEGEEFFNWMHDQLLEVADAVFIDSRTGVTEMGGVCARQLADVVVSFCAPNAQNLDGAARMMDSFKRPDVVEARQRELYSLAIPARVEMQSEQRLRNDFRLRFRSAFERRKDLPPIFQSTLKPSLWDLKIPYVSAFAFQERLVIGQTDRFSGLGAIEELERLDPEARKIALQEELEKAEQLEEAYNKLANHLAVLAPEGSTIRKQFTSRLEKEFPELLPQVALSYLISDGESAGRSLRERLEGAGISLWPDLDHGPDMPEERILQTVSQARILILVVTPHAITSAVLRGELRHARQQGKCIYLIRPGKQESNLSLAPWMQNLPVYDVQTQWPALLKELKTPCQALRAPDLAPLPPDVYVERPEDLAKLKDQLLSAALTTTPSYFALWGPPGCGKSVVAARICQDEDIVDAYPGGVLWINVGERPDLFAELTRVFRAVSDEPLPVVERPDSTEAPELKKAGQVRQLIQALNERLTGRNLLLVLDDVWDRSHVDDLAKLGDRGSRIITTRDLAIATAVSARTFTIGDMTDEQAVELLRRRSTLQGLEQAQLHEIAALVQNQPLALTLASSALQRANALGQTPDGALETVREKLRTEDSMAFDRLDSAARNDAVGTSVNASWERLATWQQARFLQLASAFDSETFTGQAARSRWEQSETGSGEPRDWKPDVLLQRFCELTLLESDSQKGLSVRPVILAFLKGQGLIQRKHALERKARRIRSSEDKRKHDVDLARARAVLGGEQATANDLKQLARSLQRLEYFGYARQLWARARRLPESQKDPQRLELAQKQAVCTYKDQDLPAQQRYSRALEILREVEDLPTTTNQETLGITGAIYKYKWMSDGQLQDLERSAAYYSRGYAAGVGRDNGYTGINAAFVLDLLADQESRQAAQAGLTSRSADARREQARRIREDIITLVAPLASDPGSNVAKDWWVVVTVAEAYFGLQRYDPAQRWLKKALELEYEEWQLQSTARQLGWIAYLTPNPASVEESPAWRTLRAFLGNDAAALRSMSLGKVGIALSGGGFRASLYHIGVLARLAELDLLRHIEVLSCISGGSIIGARYYLEVRRLLQTKTDAEITRQDYLDIIQTIERDFLAGVQKNIRTRVLAQWWTNFKTVFFPRYSRTLRLGELFEKYFYTSGDAPKSKVLLNKLFVCPKEGPEDFQPKLDNWRRSAKAPILVLNATALNTGHNWQFTASWMGEPPLGLTTEVDANDLLRRMYYWEAPPKYQDVRLGLAVIASACVPGLFEPVELKGLYPERTVRLVDGGVHDNQGVGGLLEQDCSIMFVSDASGQMGSINHPGAEIPTVLLRSNSVLGSRVRSAEYRELDARRRSSLLRGLGFVHLKKDLTPDPIDWIGCTEPYEVLDDALPVERRGPRTRYGMFKEVQKLLSGIRTDLDSFSDLEAYALMMSGYRMTDYEVKEKLSDLPVSQERSDKWQFLAIEKILDRSHGFEARYDDLLKQLEIGRNLALKPLRLSLLLRASAVVAVVGLLVWMVVWTRAMTANPAFGLVLLLALIAAIFAALAVLIYVVFRVFQVRKPMGQIVTGLAIILGGFIPARLSLWLENDWFLKHGRVDRKGGWSFLSLSPVLLLLWLAWGTWRLIAR